MARQRLLGVLFFSSLFLVGCPPEVVPVCGDGVVSPEISEQCDGTELNGTTCEDLGFAGGGTLLCNDQCGFNTVGCVLFGGGCGDGIQDQGEDCDDGNTSAGDGCNSLCQDESCGDGIDNDGNAEQCDDGNQSNTDGCLNNCQSARCGDNFVQTGFEGCDDGNALNTDACTGTCQPAECGDGFVRTNIEECDDSNTSNGDGCDQNCLIETPAGCGNNILEVNLGEECEDGNTNNNDGCSAACQIESCNDGVVQAPLGEQCDDGNNTAGDGCNAQCRNEFCGDGIKNNGQNEQCDDGNTASGDGCNNQCRDEFCGDGVDNDGANEGCDDGNANNNDACTTLCQPPTCGDTIVSTGEQCDDGNQSNTDACRNCQNAVCGDGFIRSGTETCDDGNTANGDGCSSVCQIETFCGNGVAEGAEQCDDNNEINTDACLDTCVAATCGDGFIRDGFETCDDNNANDNDGCSSLCQIEQTACTAPISAVIGNISRNTTGRPSSEEVNGCFNESKGPEEAFLFTPPSNGTLTLDLTDDFGGNDQVLYVRTVCGDRLSEIACADDLLGGQGEILETAVNGGTPLFIFVDGFFLNDEGPYTLSLLFEPGATCGNGAIEGAEQCDDGNTIPGDGCESDCTFICGDTIAGVVRATLDTSNNHCYVGFSNPLLNWFDAELDCEAKGGTLAVITSEAENTLARNASLITDTVWIGADDTTTEGSFTWINGEPFSFSKFEPGQPDDGFGGEDCLHFFDAATSPAGLTNTWNDTKCGDTGFVTGYICEFELAGGKLVINEVDYDQIGNNDSVSFIELKNIGTAPVALDDFTLVLINGNGNAPYSTIPLSGGSLAPGAFMVVANATVNVPAGTIRIDRTGDFIQNGNPDGIAIFQNATNQLVDALSYEGSMDDVSAGSFGSGFNLVEGTALAIEVADSNTVDGSLCRFPDGTDTNNASSDWAFRSTPTPGATNQ